MHCTNDIGSLRAALHSHPHSHTQERLEHEASALVEASKLKKNKRRKLEQAIEARDALLTSHLEASKLEYAVE